MRPALRPALRLGLLLALVSAVVALQGSRLAQARGRAAADRQHLAWLEGRAREVLALRQSREQVAEGERPEQDVLFEVHTVMADAGIPQARLTSLERNPDEAVPAPGGGRARHRRQSFQLQLSDVSLGELGAFLTRWRERSALWTPVRMELTHASRGATPTERIQVRLFISALYLAED